MKKIMLILFLVSIILISGCIRLPQACKLDAKVCPDGTSVGRDPSSKNCEEFILVQQLISLIFIIPLGLEKKMF